MQQQWFMDNPQWLPEMLHQLQVRIAALRKLHIERVLQLLIEALDGQLVFFRKLLERLEPTCEQLLLGEFATYSIQL
jgi:hypothetical protein